MTARAVLSEIIRANASAIPFEQFMSEALYNETFGYYSRNIRSVGRHGDFSTSPTLADALGRAIARWAAAELAATNTCDLIEIGAGTGELAGAVLQHIGWFRRMRVRFHIVEVSAPLRRQQEEQLRGKRVSWHESVADALDACDGCAVLFSNEFVDAFPCRILVWNEGTHNWDELFVDETLGEIVRPRRELPAPSSALSLPARDGQRCEIHYAYRDWLKKWIPRLRRGTLLTIDYGDEIERLYYRRPRGTVRAYFKQNRLEGPEVYERAGHQDITADVNFTDLRHWGEEAGFSGDALLTQAEFIRRWAPEVERVGNSAVDFLLAENGAGAAFKVLCQRML